MLADPAYTFHLGVAADELLKAPQNNGAPPATTQTADLTTGKITTSTVPSPYSIVLSDQPELRVDTTTFANTGTLGSLTNPVTGAQVYDFEAAGNYRNFFFQGEYFHYVVQRRDLATAEFDGGYGQVAWTLTGESHKYNPASASYLRIVPEHAFSAPDGYWGAWEIAGRVSYVDLVDHFNPTIPIASQPSAVNGGRQTSYALALNWYPNSYLRFMLDYLHTDFDKANSTATSTLGQGAPAGASIDALALRTQVSW